MEKFAEYLGFNSETSLINMSEVAVTEGDIHWYITQLPDGCWAAWDDAELSLEQVEIFPTREQAVYYHRQGFEATDLPEDAWQLESPLIGDLDALGSDEPGQSNWLAAL